MPTREQPAQLENGAQKADRRLGEARATIEKARQEQRLSPERAAEVERCQAEYENAREMLSLLRDLAAEEHLDVNDPSLREDFESLEKQFEALERSLAALTASAPEPAASAEHQEDQSPEEIADTFFGADLGTEIVSTNNDGGEQIHRVLEIHDLGEDGRMLTVEEVNLDGSSGDQDVWTWKQFAKDLGLSSADIDRLNRDQPQSAEQPKAVEAVPENLPVAPAGEAEPKTASVPQDHRETKVEVSSSADEAKLDALKARWQELTTRAGDTKKIGIVRRIRDCRGVGNDAERELKKLLKKPDNAKARAEFDMLCGALAKKLDALEKALQNGAEDKNGVPEKGKPVEGPIDSPEKLNAFLRAELVGATLTGLGAKNVEGKPLMVTSVEKVENPNHIWSLRLRGTIGEGEQQKRIVTFVAIRRLVDSGLCSNLLVTKGAIEFLTAQGSPDERKGLPKITHAEPTAEAAATPATERVPERTKEERLAVLRQLMSEQVFQPLAALGDDLKQLPAEQQSAAKKELTTLKQEIGVHLRAKGLIDQSGQPLEPAKFSGAQLKGIRSFARQVAGDIAHIRQQYLPETTAPEAPAAASEAAPETAPEKIDTPEKLRDYLQTHLAGRMLPTEIQRRKAIRDSGLSKILSPDENGIIKEIQEVEAFPSGDDIVLDVSYETLKGTRYMWSFPRNFQVLDGLGDVVAVITQFIETIKSKMATTTEATPTDRTLTAYETQQPIAALTEEPTPETAAEAITPQMIEDLRSRVGVAEATYKNREAAKAQDTTQDPHAALLESVSESEAIQAAAPRWHDAIVALRIAPTQEHYDAALAAAQKYAEAMGVTFDQGSDKTIDVDAEKAPAAEPEAEGAPETAAEAITPQMIDELAAAVRAAQQVHADREKARQAGLQSYGGSGRITQADIDSLFAAIEAGQFDLNPEQVWERALSALTANPTKETYNAALEAAQKFAQDLGVPLELNKQPTHQTSEAASKTAEKKETLPFSVGQVWSTPFGGGHFLYYHITEVTEDDWGRTRVDYELWHSKDGYATRVQSGVLLDALQSLVDEAQSGRLKLVAPDQAAALMGRAEAPAAEPEAEGAAEARETKETLPFSVGQVWKTRSFTEYYRIIAINDQQTMVTFERWYPGKYNQREQDEYHTQFITSSIQGKDWILTTDGEVAQSELTERMSEALDWCLDAQDVMMTALDPARYVSRMMAEGVSLDDMQALHQMADRFHLPRTLEGHTLPSIPEFHAAKKPRKIEKLINEIIEWCSRAASLSREEAVKGIESIMERLDKTSQEDRASYPKNLKKLHAFAKKYNIPLELNGNILPDLLDEQMPVEQTPSTLEATPRQAPMIDRAPLPPSPATRMTPEEAAARLREMNKTKKAEAAGKPGWRERLGRLWRGSEKTSTTPTNPETKPTTPSTTPEGAPQAAEVAPPAAPEMAASLEEMMGTIGFVDFVTAYRAHRDPTFNAATDIRDTREIFEQFKQFREVQEAVDGFVREEIQTGLGRFATYAERHSAGQALRRLFFEHPEQMQYAARDITNWKQSETSRDATFKELQTLLAPYGGETGLHGKLQEGRGKLRAAREKLGAAEAQRKDDIGPLFEAINEGIARNRKDIEFLRDRIKQVWSEANRPTKEKERETEKLQDNITNTSTQTTEFEKLLHDTLKDHPEYKPDELKNLRAEAEKAAAEVAKLETLLAQHTDIKTAALTAEQIRQSLKAEVLTNTGVRTAVLEEARRAAIIEMRGRLTGQNISDDVFDAAARRLSSILRHSNRSLPPGTTPDAQTARITEETIRLAGEKARAILDHSIQDLFHANRENTEGLYGQLTAAINRAVEQQSGLRQEAVIKQDIRVLLEDMLAHMTPANHQHYEAKRFILETVAQQLAV